VIDTYTSQKEMVVIGEKCESFYETIRTIWYNLHSKINMLMAQTQALTASTFFRMEAQLISSMRARPFSIARKG